MPVIAILLLLDKAPGVFTISQRAVNSPYPPSFDNNPIVFGLALFGRLLVLLLASSTIVRMHYLQAKVERLPANNPVYIHRMSKLCFLYGAMLGSSSDCLTYMLWNETSEYWTTLIMLLARLLDASTAVTIMLALFSREWVAWLRQVGLLPTAPTVLLNGSVHDLKATWPSLAIPAQFLFYSAGASVLLTAAKYLLWLEHGAR